jgi:predicted Rossmann-fold nucleotide-binding protein
VGVLDVDGFYAPLRQMVGAALEQGFIRPAVGEILSFDDDLGRLLDTMARADLPDLERWLTP